MTQMAALKKNWRARERVSLCMAGHVELQADETIGERRDADTKDWMLSMQGDRLCLKRLFAELFEQVGWIAVRSEGGNITSVSTVMAIDVHNHESQLKDKKK